MYMLLSSQSAVINSILSNNLANIRLGRRQKSTAGLVANSGNGGIRLRRAYEQVFGSVNKQLLPMIIREAIYLRPSRKNNQSAAAALLFSNPSILPSLNIRPTHGLLPFQIRLFHTHQTKKPASEQRFGGGVNAAAANTTSSSNMEWFKKLMGTENVTYEEYKKQLDKLDTTAKNAYNDGFILATFSNRFASKPKKTLGRRILHIFIFAVSVYFFFAIFGPILRQFTNISFEIITNQNQMFTMEQEVNVTFDDVCGVDEAKMELQEIVDYLRDQDKYTRLGARLPKGVLLVGPPGTGKTLLARAIAGEASVPFFHSSGSEFDELLVGQGAKRVRELFNKAKENAPCIVFIDEIDSVGGKRTSSAFHPYANQTINQLLSEMDGFVQNEGVIVIGATNKKENLDPALLRPGRFDVEVQVPIPDLMGRKEIFELYLDKIIHDDQCDPMKLARGTYGFTGASIENMVNQATLKAAGEGAKKVSLKHLDEARDRQLMGPARLKGRHQDEEANKNTAFHEAGHAIVAMFTKHAKPLYKVTIIPRGGSLGHTAMLPEKDYLQRTKAQMLAELDVAMGGRVAEELIFGEENVTTGASSDLKNATGIAELMVKMFGMSGRVGLRDFTSPVDQNEGLFGRGPQTNNQIDEEIKRVLQESYERAKELLTKYKTEHYLLAEALLEYETLNKQEVERVVKGEKLLKKIAPATRTTPIKSSSSSSGGGIKKRQQPASPITTTFFPDRTRTD